MQELDNAYYILDKKRQTAHKRIIEYSSWDGGYVEKYPLSVLLSCDATAIRYSQSNNYKTENNKIIINHLKRTHNLVETLKIKLEKYVPNLKCKLQYFVYNNEGDRFRPCDDKIGKWYDYREFEGRPDVYSNQIVCFDIDLLIMVTPTVNIRFVIDTPDLNNISVDAIGLTYKDITF